MSVALVAVFYAWVISAGRFSRWPTYGSYYGRLADAFVSGQTHLLQEPDPRLLALPDPYDPVRNRPYRYHDALLFGGRYYLYWGPVPAVLLVPFTLGSDEPVGDQHPSFWAAVGTVLMAALLLARARARLVPSGPGWMVGAGAIVVGVAGPIPFTLARASVYEAAILGGQFFLATGLYGAYRALFPGGRAGDPSADAPAVRTGWLTIASACWAAAVGCRVSLAPAVAVAGILVLWQVLRPATGGCRLWPGLPGRRSLGALAAFALPAACGALLLGYYNDARFGSWTETGWVYQLAGMSVRSGVEAGWITSPRYVPVNLLCYLFEPPRWGGTFPYVRAGNGNTFSPLLADLPRLYNAELVAGVVTAFPVLCAGLLALLPHRWCRLTSPAACAGATAARPGEARWLVLTLAVLAAIGSAPTLFLAGTTMRYLLDATPSLGVLATLGVLTGVPERGDRGTRWAFRGVVGLLFAYSVLTGVLLSFTGYQNHFEHQNPELMTRLGRALSASADPGWPATTRPPGTVAHGAGHRAERPEERNG